MGRFKILVVFTAFCLFSLAPPTFAQFKVGQKTPDFVTSTLEGEKFALSDYFKQPDHKLLILTFFATWCELCGEDLKYLQRLQDQYRDRGLGVFCVFTGRTSKIKAAKKYMEDLNVNLPILLDRKRSVSKLYKIPGLPCHYVIDSERVLRYKCIGCSDDVKRSFGDSLIRLLRGP